MYGIGLVVGLGLGTVDLGASWGLVVFSWGSNGVVLSRYCMPCSLVLVLADGNVLMNRL